MWATEKRKTASTIIYLFSYVAHRTDAAPHLMKKNTHKKPENPFKAWRLAKGLTLTALASRMGKSRASTGNLSKLERGLLGYSDPLLAALASIYGISKSAVLAGPDGTIQDPATDPLGTLHASAALTSIHSNPVNADEAQLIFWYRNMPAASQRHVYLSCADLYLLGENVLHAQIEREFGDPQTP